MAEEQKDYEFTIREGEDFIELISLLKYLGIAATGGQAKLMVENNTVMVDGVIETRKRRKVRSGMIVTTSDGYTIKVK